jgi:co-chaperonin GroES (HSP10)
MSINPVKAKSLRAVGNRVLVTDMYFGEQKTASGLIIGNDDGKTRGIYPRWAKVYAKGPDNNDEFHVGHWILIEHGRWTRGITIDTGEGDFEIRMVEAESILAYSEEKPNDVYIGAEYSDGQSVTVDPSSFIRPNI